MLVNGSVSQWTSVTRDVPQGSVVRPALFNIFINGIDKGMKCTLSTSADSTKVGGAADTPEGWDAIQKELDAIQRDQV